MSDECCLCNAAPIASPPIIVQLVAYDESVYSEAIEEARRAFDRFVDSSPAMIFLPIQPMTVVSQ